MTHVPKGMFDRAMGRFGRAFGDGFGGFIDRLNQDVGFVNSLVEFIKDPQTAFVRMLLRCLGITMTVEQLQDSISMQCSAETDKLFDRAILLARKLHPNLVEPLGTTRWEFVPYVIDLIQENRGAGLIAVQYLVFELSLRRSVIACLDVENEPPYDWSLFEGDPAVERKAEIMKRFWAGRSHLRHVHNSGSYALMASAVHLIESAWAILIHERHRRQRAQPA